MSSAVLLAVLGAALAHAGWNALIRGASDKALYTVLLHVCSGVLAVPVLLWLGLPPPQAWPYVLASATLHAAYIGLLTRAYEGGQLAVSYVLMRGSAPLLVALASAPLLGEPLGLTGWAGVLAILGGIGLLAWAGGQSPAQVLRHPAGRAALLNSVIIAAYTVIDGLGARASGNAVAYVLTVALFEPLVPLALRWRRDRQRLYDYARQHWRLACIGAVTASGAYATVLWAMTQAPIAVVAALRETSVIFAVLIGSLWFREGRLRLGLFAALLVAAGVVQIKLGAGV